MPAACLCGHRVNEVESSDRSRCRAEGCPVAEGGTDCLEGLELASCPNFVPLPEDDEVVDPSHGTEPPPDLAFFKGDALTDEELALLAMERRLQTVLIAGPFKSGKTSLIAELYNQFGEQPVRTGDWTFAGSLTMRGFEKICHRARLVARGAGPSTERTKVSEHRKHLHLAVRHTSGRRIDLAIGDISGELFDKFADTGDAGDLTDLVKRAAVVAITLDGDKLVDGTSRHAAVEQAGTLARRLQENGHLHRYATVGLVTTKAELIDPSLEDWRAKKCKQTLAHFGDRQVWSTDTSAQPRQSEPAMGEILERLCQPGLGAPTYEHLVLERSEHPFDWYGVRQEGPSDE